MIKTILFHSWTGMLLQGILMIILSIIIFNNPEAVLSTMALWLGISITLGGLVGIVTWLGTPTQERGIYGIIGSIAMLIAGLIMIFKMAITIKAITLVFGILTAVLGYVILSGGLKNKANWSFWWILVLFGGLTLITGIKSIFDSYSGSESISNIMGLAVLFSGIGLIVFAYFKRKIVNTVKAKFENN